MSVLSPCQLSSPALRVVYLDVLLKILRTLESLPTKIAFVWLERNMDSNVGSDMIALNCGGTALIPATGKVQVVCAFATNVLLADVFLSKRSVPFGFSLAMANCSLQREPRQMSIAHCTCPIDRIDCHQLL